MPLQCYCFHLGLLNMYKQFLLFDFLLPMTVKLKFHSMCLMSILTFEKHLKQHIRPNKKNNSFSGTAASVLKDLHYFFLLLSKKNAFPIS